MSADPASPANPVDPPPVTLGSDHEITCRDDGTIARRRRHPGPGSLTVRGEARLLAAIRPRLPLAVPRVLQVDDDTLVMERLGGHSLLTRLPDLPECHRRRLAAELGRFVAAVATLPLGDVAHLVPVEVPDLEALRTEAAGAVRSHVGAVPPTRRSAVLRFLARACPPPPRHLHLTHHDLGAEHVFVQGEPVRVTGIIDWSDAVIGDPAHDLGLVLRDLGTSAGSEAYPAFLAAGVNSEGLMVRALFYARVKALEDLAFGLEQPSRPHLANAVRAIDDLFGDVA